MRIGWVGEFTQEEPAPLFFVKLLREVASDMLLPTRDVPAEAVDFGTNALPINLDPVSGRSLRVFLLPLKAVQKQLSQPPQHVE